MSEVYENAYALIGRADDKTGRLDVVTLLREGAGAFWVRYDTDEEASVDFDAVISRDATPKRLLAIKAELDTFWTGGTEAMRAGKARVMDAFDNLSAESMIDTAKTMAAVEAQWVEQRQAYWRTVIGMMRKQPVLAPEGVGA